MKNLLKIVFLSLIFSHDIFALEVVVKSSDIRHGEYRLTKRDDVTKITFDSDAAAIVTISSIHESFPESLKNMFVRSWNKYKEAYPKNIEKYLPENEKEASSLFPNVSEQFLTELESLKSKASSEVEKSKIQMVIKNLNSLGSEDMLRKYLTEAPSYQQLFVMMHELSKEKRIKKTQEILKSWISKEENQEMITNTLSYGFWEEDVARSIFFDKFYGEIITKKKKPLIEHKAEILKESLNPIMEAFSMPALCGLNAYLLNSLKPGKTTLPTAIDPGFKKIPLTSCPFSLDGVCSGSDSADACGAGAGAGTAGH